MKTITTILFLFVCSITFAQEQKFLLEGRIIDNQGDPVTDVYIVNLNNHDKDISHSNGIFAIWVSPGDTLVLSHISYFRKMISVPALLINPIITLESENIDIPEVRVSPNQRSDIDRANTNLTFLNDYEAPIRMRMQNEDNEPVSTLVTEHNSIKRSEASSISIVRFSPSENIGKLFSKLKKKDEYDHYSSTRKTKEEIEKKKKK